MIIEAHSTLHTGAVAIDDIIIKYGYCAGTCSTLPSTARVACGPSAVTKTSCESTYDCCFDESKPIFPCCFYHPSSCKSIPVNERVQCGNLKISESACKHQGCCFDHNTVGIAKVHCYNSPISPTNPPTTVGPRTTPVPSQYDCTFETDLCNFINLKNDDFDWKRHQGSTTTRDTGPDADHTSQDSEGMNCIHFGYYFIVNIRITLCR